MGIGSPVGVRYSMGPRLVAFRPGSIFGAVAHGYDEEMVGVNVVFGDAGDIGGGNGAELVRLGGVIVERKVVEEDLGLGTGGGSGGFEKARNGLDGGVLGLFELGSGGWVGGEVGDFLEELGERGAGDIGTHEAAGEKAATLAIRAEVGRCAIGVAVLFAQIHVDAGGEGAAEGCSPSPRWRRGRGR